MKSIFKKITTLWLFSFVLLWVGFNVNASWGWSSGWSSSTSSSVKISAPVFNTWWVINWQVKRVCRWLPQHALWNTWSVNGVLINSIYWDLMQVTVSLAPSELLWVLTARANPTKCPIICDEWYTYNSTTISCEKSWWSSINWCENWYTKIWNDCLQNQKVITINATSCPDNIAPQNAHYVKQEDTVNLKFDWTYTNPDCEWICNDNYVLSWNNCLSIEELEGNITLTLGNRITKTVTSTVNDATNKVIFDWYISSNTHVGIDKLEVELKQGTAPTPTIIALEVEWEPYAAKNLKSDNKVVFDSIGDVIKNNSLHIVLKIEAVMDSEWTLWFDVIAKWTGPNWESVQSSAVSTANITYLNPIITIANSYAVSEVEAASVQSELLKFTINVENWSYDLMDMSAKLNAPITWLTDYRVIIDNYKFWNITYEWWDSLDFTQLDQTLTEWKHLVVIEWDVDLWDNASTSAEFNKVILNNTIEKEIHIKKLFVEAYPILSLVNKNSHDNEMILKISNPYRQENIVISWFIFQDWSNIWRLTLDGKVLWEPYNSIYSIDEYNQVILASWESTDLVITVSKNTAQLNGIIVNIDWNDVIFTDEYTNLAKWANLKITHMD